MENNLNRLIRYLSYKSSHDFPNGYVLVGGNSLGKTYSMEKTLNLLYKECSNNLIYLPEYMQDIDVDIDVEAESSFSLTQTIPDTLREISKITEERISGRQEEDEEKKSVSKFILKHLIQGKENGHDVLNNFFKDVFKFELYWDNEIKIKFLSQTNLAHLTSSGYKAIIRITTELYMSINQIIKKNVNERIIVFIDEIDAKLYWENREFFFYELYNFITKTFRERTINFILSTHMPETVANIPEGFSIIKFLAGEEITFKEYNSEDFLTIEQVEKVIFDKNKSIIKESETLKRLKKIYFECLKCEKQYCYSSFRNCKNLLDDSFTIKSTKEQIIYKAIKDLQR